VGAVACDAPGDVLLASALGRIKRLTVASLRLCQRGDLGEIALRFSDRNDQLVDLRAAGPGLMAAETKDGSLRFQPKEITAEDSRGTGIQLELPQGQNLERLVPLETSD